MGNVPNLRFPEFSGEWEKTRLGDNCNIQMCKRIMAVQTNTDGGVPFYKIGTIGGKADAYISKDLFDEYKAKYSFPHKGEVMITCAGTVGKCIIYNGEDSYYQDSNIVWIDNPKEIISNDFLYHLLSKINWSHLNSTTIVRIYNDDLRNLKLYYPIHDEQKKITNFLSLINKRIATQNKIIEDLKKLKSAIIHRCYSSQTNMIPLSELLKQCSDRNRSGSDLQVLSVSNKYGFIAQSDQFEDREVASDDTSNYKVVKKGMFAYNPARINVGSIALYEMDGNGIVSPMYVCFTTKSELLPSYLKYYFASQTFKHEMYKRLEGSVRLCLTFEELCNIEIHLPSIEQQKNISKYISKIENNLSLVDSIFSKYQQQRRYLLSQMFI
mgnify:CR=1 FL=1